MNPNSGNKPRCGLPRVSALALFILATLSTVASAEENLPDTVDLDRIEVKGTFWSKDTSLTGKVFLPPREIPNSVSVITRERIEDQNLVTVADALGQVTGVTVTPNDGTQSQYRARGFPLAVMNDGIPAYSALSGYQQFDLAIYDRLEVLRGPGGVLQGSGEPGGVVNVVRKRGLATFDGNAALSIASWDNYRLTADVGGPLDADGQVRARAVGVWQDRDHFAEYTRNRKWVGYGALDWDLDQDTTLSLAVTLQDDRTQAPFSGLPAWSSGGLLDVPRETSSATPWSRYIWQTKDYLIGLEHRFDNDWTAKVQVSQRDQRFFFHDSYTADGVRASDYTVPYARREYDYDYRRQAVDVFVSGPVQWFGRRHELLFGYNYDSLDSSYGGVALTATAAQIRVPFGESWRVPDFRLPYNLGGITQTRQSGFYAQGRFSLADPLKLVIGARVSDFETRTRNQAPAPLTAWRTTFKRDSELTPYGGIVWDVGGHYSLYASYADIFVPQSTSLLRVDGTGLDPRVGKQYEIGGKAEFLDGRLNASLAAFRLRDTGRSMADPDNVGFYVNAGEVEAKGWEAEITGSPAPGLELQAGYTRLESEYVTAAASLQGQKFDAWEPKHSVKIWAVKRFAEGADSGLTIGFGLAASSGTEAGTGSSAVRSQGGYTVASAMVGYRVNPRLMLTFNANNLFDKVYYARLGGTNSYNTFGDPRNYALTARLDF